LIGQLKDLEGVDGEETGGEEEGRREAEAK